MIMTLDPEVLSAAQAARERVLQRQHELERARADLNHEIRRLHAAGGSMREISEQLGVSHQRVHQIVAEGESDALLRRLGDRLQHSLGGGFAHLTDEARGVFVHSHHVASALGAKAVAPEHVLLALSLPEAGVSARALTATGATHDALHAAIDRSSKRSGRHRKHVSFNGSSKNVVKLAFQEAVHSGDNQVGTEHLLLGLLDSHDDRTESLLDELDVAPDAIRDALAAA